MDYTPTILVVLRAKLSNAAVQMVVKKTLDYHVPRLRMPNKKFNPIHKILQHFVDGGDRFEVPVQMFKERTPRLGDRAGANVVHVKCIGHSYKNLRTDDALECEGGVLNGTGRRKYNPILNQKFAPEKFAPGRDPKPIMAKIPNAFVHVGLIERQLTNVFVDVKFRFTLRIVAPEKIVLAVVDEIGVGLLGSVVEKFKRFFQ